MLTVIMLILTAVPCVSQSEKVLSKSISGKIVMPSELVCVYDTTTSGFYPYETDVGDALQNKNYYSDSNAGKKYGANVIVMKDTESISKDILHKLKHMVIPEDEDKYLKLAFEIRKSYVNPQLNYANEVVANIVAIIKKCDEVYNRTLNLFGLD